MADLASIHTTSARRRWAATILAILAVAGIAWIVQRGDGAALDHDAATLATSASPGGLAAPDPLDAPAPSIEPRLASSVEAMNAGSSASTTAGIDVRRVVVEVVDAAGSALEGVKVTGLDLQDEGTFAEAITDVNGRAHLECEPADLLHVTRLCVGTPCLATMRAPYAGKFELTATLRAPDPRETLYVAVLDDVQIEPATGGSLRTIVIEAEAADVRNAIEQARNR